MSRARRDPPCAVRPLLEIGAEGRPAAVDGRPDVCVPAPPPRGAGRPRSKFGRFAALAASATILAGLLMWVVLGSESAGVDLAFPAGLGYQQNLAIPHNAYGLNGLKAVEKSVHDDTGLRLAQAQWRLAGCRTCRTSWNAAGGGRRSSSSPSTRGRRRSRPLPPPRRPRPPRRACAAGLPRRDRRPARRAVPRRFVLDPAQEPAMPLQGVLHNDFAAAMRNDPLAERIGRRPTSSSSAARTPDSGRGSPTAGIGRSSPTTWPRGSPARPTGMATGGSRPSTSGDSAHHRVERWAFANRGMAQTPLLLPAPDQSRRAASFELCSSPGAARPPRPAGARRGADPLCVGRRAAQAWASYRELRAATPSPAVYSPRAWRRYVDWLLRDQAGPA